MVLMPVDTEGGETDLQHIMAYIFNMFTIWVILTLLEHISSYMIFHHFSIYSEYLEYLGIVIPTDWIFFRWLETTKQFTMARTGRGLDTRLGAEAWDITDTGRWGNTRYNGYEI